MSLRIGVIGIGGLGYLQTTTYRELDDVTIVAAADVSPEARSLFEREFNAPAYDDYQAMLEDHADGIDAVTIVTPHTLHYDQAMTCLEADLHVLIEKPMVTDVGHATEIVETADERDLVVQVGYQRRFHPAFREIRRVVRSGRIGQLHTVNCHVGQSWIDNHRGTWRVNPELSGGGQLYDTGSHLLDVLLWITNADPRTVTAQIEYDEPEVDVNSALTIELVRDGRSITASVGISGDGIEITPSEGYVVWGTDGKITYSDDELVVTEQQTDTNLPGVTYSTEITSDYDFSELNQLKLRNFIDSIEGEAEPAVPATDGRRVVALTEAAYEADDRGTAVDVASLIDGELA